MAYDNLCPICGKRSGNVVKHDSSGGFMVNCTSCGMEVTAKEYDSLLNSVVLFETAIEEMRKMFLGRGSSTFKNNTVYLRNAEKSAVVEIRPQPRGFAFEITYSTGRTEWCRTTEFDDDYSPNDIALCGIDAVFEKFGFEPKERVISTVAI